MLDYKCVIRDLFMEYSSDLRYDSKSQRKRWDFSIRTSALCEYCGISEPSFYLYLSSKVMPPVDVAIKIVDFFNNEIFSSYVRKQNPDLRLLTVNDLWIPKNSAIPYSSRDIKINAGYILK